MGWKTLPMNHAYYSKCAYRKVMQWIVLVGKQLTLAGNIIYTVYLYVYRTYLLPRLDIFFNIHPKKIITVIIYIEGYLRHWCPMHQCFSILYYIMYPRIIKNISPQRIPCVCQFMLCIPVICLHLSPLPSKCIPGHFK